MAATRIGLTANISKPNAQTVLTQLCAQLEARGLEILLEEESARLLGNSEGKDIRAVAEAADFLIVLGGWMVVQNNRRHTRHRWDCRSCREEGEQRRGSF